MTDRYSVGIIGGGASGIAMGVRLTKAGFADFTIFDAESSVGGTWHVNTFPGCEVDVESHAYSFSFHKFDWSQSFAPQHEVEAYLNEVVDRFGVRSHLRLGTTVTSVTWIERDLCYELTLGDDERVRFDYVVSCVGTLSNPKYPSWPGMEDFGGPIFHSARWEHEHDLRDKRVALVGTGSTACQIGPAIAPIVGELLLFQRSPSWVLPKTVVRYDERERRRLVRQPWRQAVRRYQIFRFADLRKNRKAMFERDSPENLALQRMLEQYIASEVEDPEIAAALTPDYPVGCKRPIQAEAFYKMFNRPNVTLVPHAVKGVEPKALVDETGERHEVDAVIMATGFTAQQYLAGLRVTGAGGRDLHETWHGSPTAFLGLTVPGFPNFFMLYGPNCNGGVSAISQAEFAANAVVRRLVAARRRRHQRIDTRERALALFVKWVDWANSKRTSRVAGQCSNYFYAPDGRNVTQWPSTRRLYQWATLFLPRWALVSSRGGGNEIDKEAREHAV